jgi:hypothetical protein
MILPPDLQALMDEMWESFKETHKPIGNAAFYYTDNGEYWKKGFTAAAEHLERQIIALKGKLGHPVPDRIVLPIVEENVLATFIAKERDHLQASLDEVLECLAHVIVMGHLTDGGSTEGWAKELLAKHRKGTP